RRTPNVPHDAGRRTPPPTADPPAAPPAPAAQARATKACPPRSAAAGDGPGTTTATPLTTSTRQQAGPDPDPCVLEKSVLTQTFEQLGAHARIPTTDDNLRHVDRRRRLLERHLLLDAAGEDA